MFNPVTKLLNASTSFIEKDLHRLDAVQPDLGKLCAQYVREGKHETVLSTLSTVGDKGLLRVGELWTGEPVIEKRRAGFLRMGEEQLAIIERYVHVLAAVTPALRQGACGSEHVPAIVQVYFVELFCGVYELQSSRRKAEGEGFPSLAMAIRMLQRLGGEKADLFDVLYHDSTHSREWMIRDYRYKQDIKTLASENAKAFMAAAERIPVKGRVVMLEDLAQCNLVASPAFTNFFIEQAGSKSKAVREVALAGLSRADAALIEPLATRLLATGNVDVRAGMIEVLRGAGTTTAFETMRQHRDTEKTARIVTAIDNSLAVQQASSGSTGSDSAMSYVALDGTQVDIPPCNELGKELANGTVPEFGADDRQALQAALNQSNRITREYNEERGKTYKRWHRKVLSDHVVDNALHLFNTGKQPEIDSQRRELNTFLVFGEASQWCADALRRLPEQTAVTLAVLMRERLYVRDLEGSSGVASDFLMEYLMSPGSDFRHLERIEVEIGKVVNSDAKQNWRQLPNKVGNNMRYLLTEDYRGSAHEWLPPHAFWPYFAEHLDVFDEAFGVSPRSESGLSRIYAIKLLGAMPATPLRILAPLLEAATGTVRSGREEARDLLSQLPDLNARLAQLLDDSRQAVRAGAAEWMAERDDVSAVVVLEKRLKSEKSELVRAAILTALSSLGQVLDSYVGSQALHEEAVKGLKKVKLDKLVWLGLERLSGFTFKDGTAVPSEVLSWWTALAYKLKQPGGNALFTIYLDQLKPEDAARFSTWILDSWIAHDTEHPSDADSQEYARDCLARRKRHYPMNADESLTEEALFDWYRREHRSRYLNSSAESKGLLALATRMPAAEAAERVRAYLKANGSRTSQTSSLLELLAAIGEPATLQVVISAATRLKQKSVQKFASQLLQQVAASNHWSLDELGDRTIPVAGFDDDGRLELPCGEEQKLYLAQLDDQQGLFLQNPAGKRVKSLPTDQDEFTKASRKRLNTAKKELKQVISMQGNRLYEAVCAQRSWDVQEWHQVFREHPLMRRFVERVVWVGLDANARIQGTFRPSAEGDYTDAQDNEVQPQSFQRIALAHSALLDQATAESWQQHLKDYEVKPLFLQFGRPHIRLPESMKKRQLINDREGWTFDAFNMRSAATRLGYERDEILDGGYFNGYVKPFPSTNTLAVVEFTGNCVPEENVPSALISLTFLELRENGRRGKAKSLGSVPEVLLSECWNDYHAMAEKAAFNEQWKKVSPWM